MRKVVPAKAFLTEAWFDCWARSFLPLNSWVGPLTYLATHGPDGALIGLAPVAKQRVAGVQFSSLGGYYAPFRSILVAEPARQVAAEGLASALS
ncbi:MAG TPA: hypothetical protein VEK15_00075, partial [Vicinamibacteria bacterium]|nr:hypothetical protein [Vicinamibacteria bacterium]